MQLSHETLILARNGDKIAQSRIFDESIGIIKHLASGYQCPGIEMDDLIQEGLIGMFAAVNSFNLDKAVEFSTYSYRCIVNSMLAALKKAGRKKHEPLNTAKQISDNEQTISTEQLAIYNEQYKTLQKNISTMFSVSEQNILYAFIDGEDYKSIAQKNNISTKTVDNTLYKIRKKLKSIRN